MIITLWNVAKYHPGMFPVLISFCLKMFLFNWGSDGLVISTEIWFLSNDWWLQCGVNITWHELSGWGNQRGWRELDGRWRWNGLWYMVGLVTTSWFIISMWFSPVAGRQQLRFVWRKETRRGQVIPFLLWRNQSSLLNVDDWSSDFNCVNLRDIFLIIFQEINSRPLLSYWTRTERFEAWNEREGFIIGRINLNVLRSRFIILAIKLMVSPLIIQ